MCLCDCLLVGTDDMNAIAQRVERELSPEFSVRQDIDHHVRFGQEETLRAQCDRDVSPVEVSLLLGISEKRANDFVALWCLLQALGDAATDYTKSCERHAEPPALMQERWDVWLVINDGRIGRTDLADFDCEIAHGFVQASDASFSGFCNAPRKLSSNRRKGCLARERVFVSLVYFHDWHVGRRLSNVIRTSWAGPPFR